MLSLQSHYRAAYAAPLAMNDSPISMKEFKHLVREAMESMPDEIKQFTDNVVVEVDDWPSDELLLSAGLTMEDIQEGDSLFGLFEPFEMPHDGIDFQDHPHKLWIFKGPHEEEFGDDPKRLRTEIRKTVVHELAHHFGWTDRDLERFDANPDPFEK